MNEETLIIEGYQPVARFDGYQRGATVQNGKGINIPISKPIAMVNIIPPKGGTGEVSKK